jgi:probable proton-coupled thiamine transporter YuaJ
MNSSKTKILVECAIMIALSAVLSMVQVFKMPLGGSITLFSMLPVCLFSIKNGVKWGFACTFVYALVQIALDLSALMSWGLTPTMWVGSLIFDYLIAYSILGIAGIFRNKGRTGIIMGIIIAMVLRFISHFISGVIFFAIWCPKGWSPLPYSIVYNGAYMLPEMIFTIIGAVLIYPVIKRFLPIKETV